MRAFFFSLSAFIVLCFVAISCEQKKEDFQTELSKDYIPLQVGKYIIYRIDSTVFTQAGRAEEIHSYLEKHVIDAQIMDNAGRASFRVYRFLNSNLTGGGNWASDGSYVITPLSNSIEVVENNMRTIRLINPVQKDITWKGNRYIVDEPYYPLYDFTSPDNKYPSDWNFEMTEVNGTVSLNNKPYNNVVTVKLIDEKNLPDTLTANSNSLSIPSTASLSFWIKGSGTDSIKLTAAPPANQGDTSLRLNIYNATNKPLSLNTIPIPINYSRSYQYRGNKWDYPLVKTKVPNTNRDTTFIRDTVYNDLPYGIKSYGVDKYAKNIGLIYQELALWEYQPNPGGAAYKIGFAVKRSIVEHN
jgi:hypothetical protein